jgi:transketolase
MMPATAPTLSAGTAPHAEVSHADMANAIRALTMDAIEKSKSGHPGMPMGMADVATVLFTKFLKIDPTCSTWPDRDRFVLSAGHGSMLQYALHHLVGYPDMPMSELQRFRQLGAKTAGHPEYGHALGIEMTTGPLGQGIATAVGMAIAERMMHARFGSALVDHLTYVIAGDGCLMEGISQEAIDLAGHLRLSRLVVLWDDNAISIDGKTSLSTSTNQLARFRASGWRAVRIDGHDPEAIEMALHQAKKSRRPTLIACRTIIGKGAPNKQGSEATHGAPLGEVEVAAARSTLGWSAAPFEIPAPILAAWRAAGSCNIATRKAWEARLENNRKRQRFEAAIRGELPRGFRTAFTAYKASLIAGKPKVATRKASEMALGVINASIPAMVGGSADLSHSNLTITAGQQSVQARKFGGSYLRYGIREHGMAAAMNGLALHGGLIPYGGTFLVFSDYMRGAMRLSALMEQRVIYVLTHDSIGLGEDGPTHQPIEHVTMLRATPNMTVFRPCDAVETAEAWEIALESPRTPSALCLSRQNLPTLRESVAENLTARGAYILRQPDGLRDLTLLATGSEVEIAVQAADRLTAAGRRVAVVSMPSWELFERQPETYRRKVLGTAPRIGIEALARLGWDRWIGETGVFIGMEGFGASAPAPDLYRHFGITVEAVLVAADRLIR